MPDLGLGYHRPVGDTDSEYAFCALLHQLSGLWLSSADPPDLQQRYIVVARFAGVLGRLGMANFIYADGDTVFVHGNRRQDRPGGEPRPPGLFVLHRDCATNRTEFCAQGLQISSGSESQEMTLVASVPLTGEPWQPVGEGVVLALRGGRVAERTA